MKQNPKIFIAEDEESLAEICKVRFINAGFSTTVFKNGLELLETLATETPNVILLDINMPEMNGFDVLSSIHKNFEDQNKKDVTVIVWSNINNDFEVQKAVQLGAKAFLRKVEYMQGNLVEKVMEIISEKK